MSALAVLLGHNVIHSPAIPWAGTEWSLNMYFLDECKILNYRSSLVILLSLLNAFIYSTVETPFHRHFLNNHPVPLFS